MKFRQFILALCTAAACLPAAASGEDAGTNTNSITPVVAAATNLEASSPAGTQTDASATNQAALIDTNAPPVTIDTASPIISGWDEKLKLAQLEHREHSYADATRLLETILKTNVSAALQRNALFELASVIQDSEQPVRAQQVWAQFLHTYSDDPQVPDVLLRQGLLYRKMGANGLAISKFYAVMSSAVKLKEDNFEHYKSLVTQAQTEIADTYFLDAKFDEAADYYNRILKGGDAESNRMVLEAKLIRTVSYLTNHSETISKSQSFLNRFPKSPDVPEVRFILATALKSNGRNSDSMQQVLLLLQSQEDNAKKDPETWAYWQRRAGNEIANQLYKEGDYADALQIYLSLADLDKSPVWQIPVWYQIGLDYEQLQQWDKATDTYTRILDRQKDLDDTSRTPAIASMLEMAKWRKDYIAWMQNARINKLAVGSMENLAATNRPAQ